MSTSKPHTADAKSEWLPLLLVAAIAAVIAVVYASTVSGAVDLWENSEYRYTALVFPISAYLLWRMRGALAALKFAPWLPGVALVFGLVVVWGVAHKLDVQVVEQLATVLLIPAVVATLLGLVFLKRALFPLAFLVAAVPMGDGLLPVLMGATADISLGLLRLSGVPVFREGQFFTLPGGTFEVADVCAGLNYLVSGLMVGVLFAYLTYRSNMKRAVFVGATAAVLVAANGLRAFIVMYVASATELRYMAGSDHVWFGWFLFGIVIVALFLAGAHWSDRGDDSLDGRAGLRSRGRSLTNVLPLALVLVLVLLAATAQRLQADLGSNWKFLLPIGAVLIWLLAKRYKPQGLQQSSAQASQRDTRETVKAAAAVILVAGVLVTGPLLFAETARNTPRGGVSVMLPHVSGCAMQPQVSVSWQSDLPAVDYSGAAAYRCASGAVRAFVAGYWGVGAGRETHLLVPSEWRYSPAVEIELELPHGRTLRVNELHLPGHRVWYWYRVGGRTALTPVGAKLLLASGVLRADDPSSAVFIVEASPTGVPEADRHRLAELAVALDALVLPAAVGDSVERSTPDVSHASGGSAGLP